MIGIELWTSNPSWAVPKTRNLDRAHKATLRDSSGLEVKILREAWCRLSQAPSNSPGEFNLNSTETREQ